MVVAGVAKEKGAAAAVALGAAPNKPAPAVPVAGEAKREGAAAAEAAGAPKREVDVVDPGNRIE